MCCVLRAQHPGVRTRYPGNLRAHTHRWMLSSHSQYHQCEWLGSCRSLRRSKQHSCHKVKEDVSDCCWQGITLLLYCYELFHGYCKHLPNLHPAAISSKVPASDITPASPGLQHATCSLSRVGRPRFVIGRLPLGRHCQVNVRWWCGRRPCSLSFRRRRRRYCRSRILLEHSFRRGLDWPYSLCALRLATPPSL